MLRYTWLVLIILFICLCFYQIGAQAMMYWLTPVATNIIAMYPESLAFPGRRPNSSAPNWFRRQLNESDVFDRVMLNSWDMDAGRFLRTAAHQRSRMIVRCELPNGSQCSPKDFRPLWTLTGLCWAINTDPDRPMQVTGAGPGNALRLLVNVERYERVESCTPKLRARSLPGVKVLIINQTDIPASYLEGVNVPAGFTMDIPFWMRQRQKLPGRDCVVFSPSEDAKRSPEEKEKDNSEREDARGCLMSSYLGEVERRCNCSMRQAFLQKAADPSPGKGRFTPCNVLQYFDCVQAVLEWAKDKGFSNFRHCPVPCESIDYTAWQDMNELPANIFPRIISFGNNDEEDDDEANDSGEEDEENSDELNSQNYHHCAHNQMLRGQHVLRIKKAARDALEKQARFQEDIQIRTRRMIAQLRRSVERLIQMRWGWRQEHFLGVQRRLAERLRCYDEVPRTHANVFNAMANPKPQGEEERAQQLQELLLGERRNNATKRAKSIEEVRRTFGQKAETRHREMLMARELTSRIYSLFSVDSFTKRLPSGLERMDKVLQLIKMYEGGQMSRKSWAERMQTRNMRHFLEEDLYEDWHNLIVRDMEQNVLEVIQKIEDLVPLLYQNASNGTAILCIFNGIRNETAQMLREFQRAMYELQSALTVLFRKELPEYLQNMEFGPKFIQENFAQVNVFLHKMNIEYWRQEPTYSIWSFFCDIGATMSLFLGASMLTIIEVLYFVLRHSRIYRSIAVWRHRKNPLATAEDNDGADAVRKVSVNKDRTSFVLV
uniref:Amiloride-sensitive sodium channel n=1 Tax=Globodera rostochiensis TaxID=31243 RepID=A0A914H202_GLORO